MIHLLFLSVNIAKGKPATQSSRPTGSHGYASRAVDGDTETMYLRHSCTQTKQEKGAWWRVDLLDRFRVRKVKITNRGDCCWTRLRRFEIRVGSNLNPVENEL